MIDWLGFHLVMHFEAAIDPYTWFGRWCLRRAGSHVYSRHQ
jgi:hypothetical protein